MKKWECTICSYIHEGDAPPDECPVCGADKSAFVEVVDKAETEQGKAASPENETSATTEAASTEASTDTPPLQTPAASPNLWAALLAKGTELILKHHLHPIAVHSPNGIMPMAFTFLLIAALLGLTSFDAAALYSLVFILISMPVVIFTGYIAWKNRYRGALTPIFKIKITCSAIMLFSLVVLICWRALDPQVVLTSGLRWLYLLVALVALGAAGMAGHLGGKLIMGTRK